MPRCLMAKKWKAYPWPDRVDDQEDQQQEQQLQPQDQHLGHPAGGGHPMQQQLQHQQQQPLPQQQQHQQHQQHQQQTSGVMEKRQQHRHELEEEEIDVVGDTDSRQGDHQQTCWGPHSPTAGATAPSPPPLNASGALYYHGYTHEAWINHEEPPKYATLRSAAELARPVAPSPPPQPPPQPPQPQEIAVVVNGQTLHPTPHQSSMTTTSTTSSSSLNLPPRKSLSMCFTSTGTALSLPPKKKDIYRPYSLQPTEIRTSAEEDLSAAQAILDLSASPAAPTHSVFIHTLSSPLPLPPQPSQPQAQPQPQSQQQDAVTNTPPAGVTTNVVQLQSAQIQSSPITQAIPVSVLVPVPASQTNQLRQQEQTPPQPQSPATAEATGNCSGGARDGNSNGASKTVAYTYEAFFVSDGRSKRRGTNTNTTTTSNGAAVPDKEAAQPDRPKFTCTECGKQYATSSNLSRHKQTHRSLDSQSAKKCIHCGKAYVSMPALAMHVLTHKLAHSCGVCGKMFSRPWLLQGHLRSHTGEKPYGCAHCGKAFADRSNLRAHMQTHSADKNYECSRCHKTFALKSYLNKHLESACLRDDEMAQQSPALQPQQSNAVSQQQQQQPGGNNQGLQQRTVLEDDGGKDERERDVLPRES